MPIPFSINLGGIPILLKPDKASGQFDFVKKTKYFETRQEPAIELQVHCGWFPKLSNEKVIFETDFSWQMVEVNGNRGIKIRNQNMFQMGIFPQDYKSGDIYVASKINESDVFIFPFAHPLGELFMVNLLSTGLGILFHAAGVIYNDEGYIFAGKGGAGKSTTARLWAERQGVKVLNDDKVIVRQVENHFRLYGTPWHGQGGLALMDSAPLKHIFLLKQAKHNFITPESARNSVSRLLNSAFLPLWDKEKMDFCLKFLDNLVGSIPCDELGFLPDHSAVDVVINH